MKSICIVLSVAFLTLASLAETPDPVHPPEHKVVTTSPGNQGRMFNKAIRINKEEMGKWWENSEVAKKLQLSDDQVSKLNDIFYDHRLKLIDEQAEVEKQNLKLQRILDQDNPDEGQVGTQVDQELAARGRLEREFTMMNLDLRKVLSVAQWRQLKAMQEEHDGPNQFFFYQKFKGPNGPMRPDFPPPPPGPEGKVLMRMGPVPPDVETGPDVLIAPPATRE